MLHQDLISGLRYGFVILTFPETEVIGVILEKPKPPVSKGSARNPESTNYFLRLREKEESCQYSMLDSC